MSAPADTTTTAEREVLAGCLGRDCGFRLIVEGLYRPREIDILIASLEVTKLALLEEEYGKATAGPHSSGEDHEAASGSV